MAFNNIQPTQKLFKFNEIIKNLGLLEGMVVADLGSGSGYITIEAARAVGNRGRVYAVDVQDAPLSALKGKMDVFGLRNIEPTMANLEIPGDLKIEPGSVDMVIIANLLYQTKKHDVIMAEAKRICRDGGRLLVVDWKKQAIKIGPDVKIRVDKEDARRLVEDAGFEYVQDVKAGDFFYAMLFRKYTNDHKGH